MLEARITIDDDLAARGFKRAMSTKAIVDISAHYAWMLTIVWMIVSVVDGFFNAGELITVHLLFLTGLWIFATARRYFEWSRETASMKGWSFDAVVDELGVIVRRSFEEEQVSWSSYKNYVEFDHYLQIEDENGNFSFLPKTPELFEIVEFTKQKILEKR